MKDVDDTVASLISLLAFVFLFTVEPFVAKTLWWWFVVPLGLPALSWATAAGINLILNIWLGPRITKAHTSAENLFSVLAQTVRVGMAFGFGWFIHVVTR